ncbi:MAG: hypothetical protein V4654_02255 [Bdellovibrionota bacterium]
MNLLILPFIFLFPFILQAAELTWGLNDVTYIMPLPSDAADNNLLKLQSAGSMGELVPEAMVMQLPFMDMQHEKNEINAMTRLMTVRIDHCFPLPTPLACQKQVRMIWQPLKNTSSGVTTIDAAFHSFYVLSEEEFINLTTDLKAWKKKFQAIETDNAKVALDIHPLWKKDLDASPSLKEFNTLITKYSGEKNLSRVTVMVLRRMNDVWGFLGAEVVAGKLVPGAIPRLDGKTSQMFFNQLNNSKGYTGAGIAQPPATQNANLGGFITQATTSGTFTEAEVITNLQSAYAIENPKLFNPESMDCVNCHVAQAAREYLTEKLSATVDQNLFSAFKYTNKHYNLENKSTQVFNTHQLRGVGYFGVDLAISQRVINESADVAEWLSFIDYH